jgi:hypothetical protein
MLRRTSKRVKEVVDKMRLPAVVRLSRSFWDATRNGTEKETPVRFEATHRNDSLVQPDHTRTAQL